VWKAVVNGQVLRFRLAGINNQNFLMQDEQTGTWWQQVSGEAVQGPLRGQRLELEPWDEVSFTLFRREHPNALVLAPDPTVKEGYASADWEAKIAKMPTVTPVDPADRLQPRDLVVGIELGGVAKAYPMETLVQQSPVLDVVGGVPILLVVAEDGRSVRAFRRDIEEQTLELFRKTDTKPITFVDAQTGSTWDFAGRASAGSLQGQSLDRVQTLKDYWFDWKQYHGKTEVFAAGV
jgi:uncharacterized protein DUF3179